MSYKNDEYIDENYGKKLIADAAMNSDGKYAPSIFIGLGGTGQKALYHLRKRLYERFSKASLDGMAFLAMDTDTSDQRISQGERANPIDEQIDFSKQEQLHIAADVKHILSDLGSHPNVQEWMDPNMRVEENFQLSQGAGQMRPVSRLVGLEMKDDICGRISAARASVLDSGIESERLLRGENVKIHVYIIAGLAGGTGSGLFLDVAAMVRKTLDSTTIKGFFVLPDCYEKVEQNYPKIAANGAAALRELNHFITRSFPVPWDRHDEPIKGLFEQVFLFGGRNREGEVISHPNDPYLAIGEALFMRFSTGGLPGFIDSVFSNRVQYLSQGVSYNYEVRRDDGELDQLTRAHSWRKAFSSFGIAKLSFPSWRLLHYARFDLGLKVLAALSPSERVGQASMGVWRDQFLFKWGILHGDVECSDERFKEEFRVGKHWLVRDALFQLPGEKFQDIPSGIQYAVQTLLGRAPQIYQEEKSKQQIHKLEQKIDAYFGNPEIKSSAGEWTEQIWRNSKNLQTNLRKSLNETIEWFYAKYGLSGVCSIIEDSIGLLEKDAKAGVHYISGMEEMCIKEKTRSNSIKETYDNQITVVADAGSGWLAKEEVHKNALVKFGQLFTQYWNARFKSFIAKESATVFRFSVRLLKDKLHEIKTIKDVLQEYSQDFEYWKDHFAKPVEATMFKELPQPNLGTLLAPYLGANGTDQKERIEKFVEVSLQSKALDINSYSDLVEALIQNKDSFKKKLLHHLYTSLRGKSVGEGSVHYTKAFDVMGETRDEGYLGEKGFIETWSIGKMLSSENLFSQLEDKATKLIETGAPWIRKASSEKLGHLGGNLNITPDTFISLPKIEDAHSLSKVESLLSGIATTKGLHINFIRDGDPSEIVMYSEEHAFPVFHHSGIHSNNGFINHYEKTLYDKTNKQPLHLFRDYHNFDQLKAHSPREQESIKKILLVILKAQMLGMIRSTPQDVNNVSPLSRHTYLLAEKKRGQVNKRVIGVESSILRNYKDGSGTNNLMELIHQCTEKENYFLQNGGSYEYLYTLADYWLNILYPVRKDHALGTSENIPYGSIHNMVLQQLKQEFQEHIFLQDHYKILPLHERQSQLDDAVISYMSTLTEWTRPVADKPGYPMVKKTPMRDVEYQIPWKRKTTDLLTVAKDHSYFYLENPHDTTHKWFHRNYVSVSSQTLPALAVSWKFFAPPKYNVTRPKFPDMIAKSKTEILENFTNFLKGNVYSIDDLANVNITTLDGESNPKESPVSMFEHEDFSKECRERSWVHDTGETTRVGTSSRDVPPQNENTTLVQSYKYYSRRTGEVRISIDEIVEKIQADPEGKHEVHHESWGRSSAWKSWKDVSEIVEKVSGSDVKNYMYYSRATGEVQLPIDQIVTKIQADPEGKHEVHHESWGRRTAWKSWKDVPEIAQLISGSVDDEYMYYSRSTGEIKLKISEIVAKIQADPEGTHEVQHASWGERSAWKSWKDVSSIASLV
jgi:hypothetical protein